MPQSQWLRQGSLRLAGSDNAGISPRLNYRHQAWKLRRWRHLRCYRRLPLWLPPPHLVVFVFAAVRRADRHPVSVCAVMMNRHSLSAVCTLARRLPVVECPCVIKPSDVSARRGSAREHLSIEASHKLNRASAVSPIC